MATTVPMIAPDGTSGDIPAARAQDAINAGFKKAVPMTSPDGKSGYIPEERMNDAMKAGFKPQMQPGVKQVGTNPAGQPIYGPEGTAPEQTFGHFLTSAGDVLWNTGKGIYHALADAPQNADEAKVDAAPISGPINLRIQRMITGPMVQQGQQAIQEAQAGHPALAAGHGLAAAIPMVGPAAASVGQQLGTQMGMGDYAGAAGTAAGNAVMAAAPAGIAKAAPIVGRVVAPMAQDAAEALYGNALKPPPGSMTAAERTAKIQTGLDNSLPVSAAGVEKLGDLIDDLNTKIKNTIGSDPNRPIDPNAVATHADLARAKFAKQVNAQPDLNAIEASKQQFLTEQGAQPGKPGTAPQPTGLLDAQGRPIMTQGTPARPPQPAPPMGAADAQAMKQGTYSVLRGKYGEQGSAAVEAQKALARGLKEEIATQFSEISDLNGAESRLLDLGPILERAVNRVSNNHTIGIGGPIMAGGIKAATGSAGLAGVVGLMKSVFDIPAVKSQVAIALSKGAKIPYPQALSRVSAYQASLGSAALAPQAYSNADTANQ